MQVHMVVVGLCGVLATAATAIAQTAPPAGQETTTQQATQPQSSTQESKLTFDGDTALWTVAIRPDKTADFERVMQRLRDALMMSDDPARKKQAAGWKVVRLSMPLPDGNIGYVHMINPVVPGADYTVMQILYDAFPDERQMLYELYRGSFASNLALASGNVAVDLGASGAAAPSAPAAPTAPAPESAPAPAPAPSPAEPAPAPAPPAP